MKKKNKNKTALIERTVSPGTRRNKNGYTRVPAHVPQQTVFTVIR